MKGIWFLVFMIFLLGLSMRVMDLGTGLTTDEKFWLARSPSFIDAVFDHDWINTYRAPHPGVITMWISGIFLRFISCSDFPQKLSVARAPIALITSLSIIFIFYFIMLLFNEKIAILSATLVALDPFMIAHSRLIHQDAMLATFMILSLLAVMAFLDQPRAWLMILAGIFAGMAVLTKLPAIFLILFVPLVIFISFKDRTSLLKHIMSFGILCIATIILLWPAMWIDPVGTIVKVVTDKGCGLEVAVTTPHGSGFFWGNVSDGDYSLLYYPVSFLMMSTPITLIFSLLSLMVFMKSDYGDKTQKFNKNILILFLYVLLFMTQMAVSLKAFPRYILPVFPAIDILAGLGLYIIFKDYMKKTTFFYLLLLCVIAVQTSLLAPIAPYFLSYSNPVVFGGPSHAPEMILMGWGEGNDLAAKYINGKNNARNMTVIAQYYGFAEYFNGTTILLREKTDPISSIDADYIVFYICAVQRGYDKGLRHDYKDRVPEKVIKLNGIDYCWIYKSDRSL